VRTGEEYEVVQALIRAGYNNCEIARRTGIPRTTVRDWRLRPTGSARPTDKHPCGQAHDYPGLPARAYAYLLGMYLGDGYINAAAKGNVWHLRITLDKKYPTIIEACRQAIDILMPRQRAGVYPRKTGCVDVSHYSKHWPCLFPQHGPGPKHSRTIRLEPWQQALVDLATEDFVRGLIDSDGCRVVANDRGVRSVRYHFTNKSDDIVDLFTAALDQLGIPWTRNQRHTIAVYRKAATARMDEFVGPKSAARPRLVA
jgi:hypothetical protein